MDVKTIEKKVINALSETKALPTFGLIERIFGKGLVPQDDTVALSEVLSGLVQRGVLETDSGWYRLAEQYETAAGRPRETAARRTADLNRIVRRFGHRKTVRN